MKPITILILEDSSDRIAAFERAIGNLAAPCQLKIWHEAPVMIAEYQAYLPSTSVISLDHDLLPRGEADNDPGNGLQVASHLAQRPPHCPVIIHTSSQMCRLKMHQEFLYGGWKTELVVPTSRDWIETEWIRRVRRLLDYPR